jgi:hypothetical protein
MADVPTPPASSVQPTNSSSVHHTAYWTRAKVILYIVVAVVVLYVVLSIITTIRNVVNRGQKVEELTKLLDNAKGVFLEASTTFDQLDTTYGSLDGEYQTVFTSANAISINLETVSDIADGITDEFMSVAETFTKIEAAYSGVIEQYNDVCAIAGIAYLQTGLQAAGLPIKVIHYPFGSITGTSIDPICILDPSPDGLIYTSVGGFVDSERANGRVQDPNITPVLNGYDFDGSLKTREKVVALGAPKIITVTASIVDNTYKFVEIKAASDRFYTEVFVVDPVLYATTSGQKKYAVIVPALQENSIYVFEVNGAGGMNLRRLSDEEVIALGAGDGPLFKPATLRDLTIRQAETFDSITPYIERVLKANEDKDSAMISANRAREIIADSQEKRLDLSKTHQTLVQTFADFSVEELVPKYDILDSMCTIM